MTAREFNNGKSTIGRPRALTDAQLAAVLEWHRNRKSFKQVARENNVSVNTIKRAIESNGAYKQSSPEQREANKTQRRQQFADLKARNLD